MKIRNKPVVAVCIGDANERVGAGLLGGNLRAQAQKPQAAEDQPQPPV